MTILQALNKAYESLDARGMIATFGYSSEAMGFLILLDENGQPVGKPIDLRSGTGKKLTGRVMNVPRPEKKASGIKSNFLWEKTSYSLGVTAGDGKRTAREHANFVERHLTALAESEDVGLVALRRFVETWRPENFALLEWPDEVRDQNVVFALADEYRERMLHERPAAKAVWARVAAEGGGGDALCLVRGERGPVARLHPSVKGVWGAQSSGASIVSFNLNAFTSYGHEQGDNAPVSDAAAAAYTTVLNRFLERGSRQRIQIGDASAVFWADASNVDAALDAEDTFFASLAGIDEEKEAGKIGASLEALKDGRLAQARPDLFEGVRFQVLGLAPNAARLSVRFWFEDDFGVVAERIARHLDAMAILPPPKNRFPPLWLCLVETASQRKSENVPPNLAGEWLRAILTGAPYPLTLQSTILMRLRADKSVGVLRVAILKACLVTRGKKVPVSLDPDNRNKGYLLGRLFATYEQIQSAALGRNVNATIRDKFYGSASATPRRVFPQLDKGSVNHLSKLGKERRGQATNLQKDVTAIMEIFAPADDPIPASLSADEQALFAIGYYHQRNKYFVTKTSAAPETTDEGDPTP